jgi:hypothetical protein
MKRLIRVEPRLGDLRFGHVGNYLVPYYEVTKTDTHDGIEYHWFEEEKGEAFYFQSLLGQVSDNVTPEVLLAAEGLIAAEKLFGPVIKKFFQVRDGADL